MSVSLRVHGENINKKAQQVNGILILNLLLLLFGNNYKYIPQCAKQYNTEKQREISQKSMLIEVTLI